jgi:hypothetical protein
VKARRGQTAGFHLFGLRPLAALLMDADTPKFRLDGFAACKYDFPYSAFLQNRKIVNTP